MPALTRISTDFQDSLYCTTKKMASKMQCHGSSLFVARQSRCNQNKRRTGRRRYCQNGYIAGALESTSKTTQFCPTLVTLGHVVHGLKNTVDISSHLWTQLKISRLRWHPWKSKLIVIRASLYTSEIVLSEYTDTNRKVLQMWLDCDLNAPNWSPLFKWYCMVPSSPLNFARCHPLHWILLWKSGLDFGKPFLEVKCG